VYHYLMGAFARAGDQSGVLEVWQRMKSDMGFKPDVQGYIGARTAPRLPHPCSALADGTRWRAQPSSTPSASAAT
jgi:pentatricopeptide repeat protein